MPPFSARSATGFLSRRLRTDFVAPLPGGVDLLSTELSLDLANPGPTISNMHDLGVPAVGGPLISVTLTPADVIATTDANNQLIIAPPNGTSSDAAIAGAGWTQNGVTNVGGVNHVRYEGAGGAVLLVHPMVTNTAGLVP